MKLLLPVLIQERIKIHKLRIHWNSPTSFNHGFTLHTQYRKYQTRGYKGSKK